MKPLILGLAVASLAAPAMARDLLVTIARPANLYVFDAATRTLEQDCTMEGVFPSPGVIQMSPDGKVAYALVNRWEDIIGVNIETCETVFFAKQSEENLKRRSMASLAVSRDGSQVYTVRNPVRLHPDRHEVLPAEFAVYDTSAGLAAQPVAVHPAPRRSTVMAADDGGRVYVAAHDVVSVDPATGATEVVLANYSWDRPTYGTPDVLAFWPVGSQNDEFLQLYSAPVFADATQQEMTDFIWGYQSVNLTTGATEMKDFTSFEVIMFSAVRNPHAPNELYGVYTQLSKHDLQTGELVNRIDLPHTYYVVNISSDGRELYIGGTNDDIGVYSAETLERLGEMRIPSGGDMSLATLQVVQAE